ncbi:hypothetical protein ACJX0J_011450, partial [Zea mays]
VICALIIMNFFFPHYMMVCNFNHLWAINFKHISLAIAIQRKQKFALSACLKILGYSQLRRTSYHVYNNIS